MYAILVEEFGGPEVLQLTTLPDPTPGPGQVLVRVAACAVNRRDAWVRAGLRNRSLPRILGCDIAGTIVSVGSGVREDRVGEHVVIYPVLSCGRCRHCFSGDLHLCERGAGLLGAEADGGYCELLIVDGWRAVAAPALLSAAQAAALPIVYTTAAQTVRRTRIAPGETVFVWGASSGLGRAIVDVARLRSPGQLLSAIRSDKLLTSNTNGIDQVIAYDTEDVAERVLELTDGRGVDVVIDHVGSSSWGDDLEMLTRGGRMAIAGATTGAEVQLPLLQFLVRGLELHGCFVGSRQDFAEVVRLAEAGLLAPLVETLPLANAADAHRRLESGNNLGKLVLTLD